MKTKDQILKTAMSFMESKLVLTSVELGLYDTLEKGPQTACQVASKLKLDQVKIYDFLDALLSLGYLERSGSGESATYRASESSRAYLTSSSNDYIGGMLIMSSKRLYRIWHDLPEALATGKAQSEVKESGKHLFETMYQDPEKLYDFCKAMQSLSRENFQAFVEKFDFTQTKSHLDIGGSLGVLSSKIKENYPRIDCHSLDLPGVTELAKKEYPDLDINFIGGDMFESDMPMVDSISLGLILHDWNLEDKKKIINRAYQHLKPKGRLIVIENIIDDERRENTFGLLMSLNMLVEFGDAFDFSMKDFTPWAREAGFEKVEKLHLAGPCSALIAYKG